MTTSPAFQERERMFKQFGSTLEAAFKHIDHGHEIVERFEMARDERERELYTAMVAQSVHHTWQTLMKLLRRIAKDVDHDMPKGKGATQALVSRMAQRTSERPNILSLQHSETVRRIGELHRDYRQAKITQSSASEVIDLLSMISEEIVPEMMENIRVLALASPGGTALIGHLRPSGKKEEAKKDPKHRKAG